MPIEKTTLRKWLNDSNFDWNNGYIIYQEDGFFNEEHIGQISNTILLDHNSPILDHEFDLLYDNFHSPKFLARDNFKVYFPILDNGLPKIWHYNLDLNYYLNDNHEIPIFGEE